VVVEADAGHHRIGLPGPAVQVNFAGPVRPPRGVVSLQTSVLARPPNHWNATLKNLHIEGQSLEWLLGAATDAMLIIDPDGRIVLANPALERMFGLRHDQLIGQPVEILIPQRFRHGHVGQRGDYFTQPRARSMGAGAALFGQHSDGREFPVEVSLSPLHTGQGLPLALATIHDITERKEAEAALQESEARMRAIFETAVDAIITIDEHGILERLNPAAERLFGYREEEVAGKNVSILMPAPHRALHDGYLAHYLRTGEKKIIGKGREVQGLRRDGSVFPMDLAVAEMQLGSRRMFTGVVRDISARKQAEDKNRALLQELSSANEELTNFAYVVSHDLKAPLRGIGSLADWLATDYADQFNDEGKEHMRLLINRVHRMGALIDGILQYSRVGRVREAQLPVDLNRLLVEVVDLLAPSAQVEVRVAAGLPTVTAEPTRLQQVFHNLISNAIKYMDKPHGLVQVGCEDGGAQWRFYVRDNGPGIEQRHFERIFQLFQTLAARDRVESTGVGLALVKKIVEMYHGRIWLESEMGTGTTFWFTLPKPAGAPHENQ
jgi:two-component system sensor kinase FixL